MDQKLLEINQLGEFGLIDRIRRKFTLSQGNSVYGIGDDAAVLKEVSFKVADIFRASDDKSGTARKEFIKDELKKYEASWA